MNSKKFVSRDVRFQEDSFPFAQLHQVQTSDVTDFLIPTDNDIIQEDNSSPSSSGEADNTNSSVRLDAAANSSIEDTNATTDLPTMDINLHNTTGPSLVEASSRTIKPPIWMQDFVNPTRGQKCQYPLANSLSYSRTSKGYQCYLTKFSSFIEPQCFTQAVKDARWVEVMQLEIEALEANNTWIVVDLPKGKNAVSSKWIYKIKYQANG